MLGLKPWEMDDLFEDELEAAWRFCGGKTQAEEISAAVAWAQAMNTTDDPPPA